MKNQILTAGVYSLIFLAIFFFAEWFRRFFPKQKEVSRKLVHILCGLSALSFPYFIQSHFVVLSMVSVFALLMVLTMKKNRLTSIHGIERKSYGSLYYPLAIYLIFLLTSHKPVFYVVSIIVMTISDAFAALVGEKYGVIKYEIEGSTKSLEGSIVFFLITFLCVHLPLLLMTDMNPVNSVLIGFMIAVLVTGFEAISPSGSDNIFVPLGTYFLLMKMSDLPVDRVVFHVETLLVIIAITAFFSILKPTGIIGTMLINYAALTLCNIFWLIPLLLAEAVFFILIYFSPEKLKDKYPIRVLFYISIIPTCFIFLENAIDVSYFLFIPFLVSVTAQLPISYQLTNLKKGKALYSFLIVLVVLIPSIILYFKELNLKVLFASLFSIYIIYVINYYFHKFISKRNAERDEFPIRCLSTAIGSILAFLIVFLGVHYV